MAEAIAEARRGADEGESPIGAVAVLDDAMIGREHDRRLQTNDPTAHAVLRAVQAAANKLDGHRLSEVTIFATLEPCAMCVGALVEARVEVLVFAVRDPERGCAGSVLDLARSPALPHQVSVISGVREAEAKRLNDQAVLPA